MMSRERLSAEVALLNAKLPGRYAFVGADGMQAVLPLSDFGEVYLLNIYDLANFPEKQPVVTPGRMLRSYDGRQLSSPTRNDHCLGQYNGETILCLFSQWEYGCSLYKVVLKAHLWLVAFHLSLKTHKSIETFLPHGR